MSHRVIHVLALSLSLACLAACTFARAQAEPDVEVPDRPVWEAGVAGLGLSSPAYPGAEDRVSRVLPLPWFIYRGSVLRADGSTFGARVLKTQRIEFDVGFAGALGSSSDDVRVREGMPDLGFQFEFGPRMKINLSRPTPDSIVRFELPLRGAFELNNGIKQRGYTYEPRLSYDNREIGGGWGLSTSASVVGGDRKNNEFLYGVPPQFATPARPAYDAKAGIIAPRVRFALSHRLTQDLRFFVFTRYDFASASVNRDSPLHIASGGVSYGLGVTWTLGRSTETSPN